jgi:flagellum-specific ATP synthase
MAGPEPRPVHAAARATACRPDGKDVGTVSALARDHVDVDGPAIRRRDRGPGPDRRCTFGEILSIGADSCRVMTEGATAGLRLGMRVVNLGSPMIAPCDGWLGRIVDPYGGAMDEAAPAAGRWSAPISSAPPPPATRRGLGAGLATGLAVFDTLLPLVRGQRIGLFAGSGVGKSRLLGQLANAVEADVIVVIGLIGERGREVRDFVQETLGAEALAKPSLSPPRPIARRWPARALPPP